MSTPDPVEVVRAYHAAIDRLDFPAIELFFREDAVYRSPGTGGETHGRAAIMAAFRAYFADYPDQSSQDERIERMADDAARSVWRLTATHAGTGARLARRGEELVEIDGEGRIRRVTVVDAPAG